MARGAARHPSARLCAVFFLGGFGLLSSGCTTGLGPFALRTDRPDYNQQIVRSSDSEMLLNIVRLRYDDTPLFLELGAVVSQYGINASISGTGHVDAASGNGGASAGTSLGYSENPTMTYTPLAGEDFAERMLSPIPLDSILLFLQTGWGAKRVMLLTMQRVNDLYNAPTATGPTPETKPDYEDFADFVERFQRLRDARLVRPKNAYVAVSYRGSWFYIADSDRNSKGTFGLLNILFSLQSATGKGKSPLLTLPIGQRGCSCFVV